MRINETPPHMPTTGNPNTASNSTDLVAEGYLLNRSNKVIPAWQDGEASTGIPDHIETCLLGVRHEATLRVDSKTIEGLSSVGMGGLARFGLSHAGLIELDVTEHLLDCVLLRGSVTMVTSRAMEARRILVSSLPTRLAAAEVITDNVGILIGAEGTATRAKVESLG